MNIFDKRPLSLILCISLGGFVIFTMCGLVMRIVLLATAVALIILYLVLSHRKTAKPIMLISAFAILISMLLSYVYFDLTFKIDKRIEGEHEFLGVVVDSSSASYYTQFTVKTNEMDGKSFKNRELLLMIENTETKKIAVGDTISFSASLSGFDKTAEFDAESYYHSMGINARANPTSDIKIVSTGAKALDITLSRSREYLRRRAIMCSDELTGSMLSAFLFGEREDLPYELLLDFKRIGISHLLALSGLHLSILAMGVGKLLSLLRVKKKARTALTILFTLLYMGFTGFPVSVVRAGIMLIVTSLLFLFSRTHDALTSLVCSVTIICAITPYAIYDISLWLSALSTFGIVALGEFYPERDPDDGFVSGVLKFIKSSILSSIFAVSACLMLTAFIFKSISVLSAPSTLIFGILVEVIIFIGIPMLILGTFIPIGKLLIPITAFAKELASRMAAPRWVYVSLDNSIIQVMLIIFSAVFFAFLIFKFKGRRKWLVAICVCYAVINVQAVIISETRRAEDTLIYYSEDSLDAFVLKSDKDVCLVSSSGSSSYAADFVLCTLSNEGLEHIDKYYITAYSWGVAAQAEEVLSSVKVETLCLPTPKTPEESDILQALLPICEDFHIELLIYNENDAVSSGEFIINRDHASAYGESPVQKIIKIYYGSKLCTYVSPGTVSKDLEYMMLDNISQSSAIVFGSGSTDGDDVFIDRFYSYNRQIILNNKNVFYTQDAYRKYIENGCEIYSHPSRVVISLND